MKAAIFELSTATLSPLEMEGTLKQKRPHRLCSARTFVFIEATEERVLQIE